MQIAESKSGSITIAAFAGRLDTATAAAAEQKLMAMLREGGVVADLAGVKYVSSAGLRVLLKAAKQAKNANVSFSICATQTAVREVFEMSGFDKIIPAYATRDEAVAGG
jgi:anti-anti-sigma factor